MIGKAGVNRADPCSEDNRVIRYALNAPIGQIIRGVEPADKPDPGSITRLLLSWSGGRQAALDELVPLVYRKLRRLAAAYLRRERPDHTLQPTALVHEAYMRLVDRSIADCHTQGEILWYRGPCDAPSAGQPCRAL